jgi:hypothetical protein
MHYCVHVCQLPMAVHHLQRTQNQAARILSRTKKHDHITPVLKNLHSLPIKQRMELKIMKIPLMCFKVVHGNILPQPQVCLSRKSARHQISSWHLHIGVHRRSKTKFGDQCFSSCMSMWPPLVECPPKHIRDVKSILAFKCLLKSWLFSEAFEGSGSTLQGWPCVLKHFSQIYDFRSKYLEHRHFYHNFQGSAQVFLSAGCFQQGWSHPVDKNLENTVWQCFWRLFSNVFELYYMHI